MKALKHFIYGTVFVLSLLFLFTIAVLNNDHRLWEAADMQWFNWASLLFVWVVSGIATFSSDKK